MADCSLLTACAMRDGGCMLHAMHGPHLVKLVKRTLALLKVCKLNQCRPPLEQRL